MANPERGEVALTIEDRPYTMVLDMNALCELEDLLSTPTKPVTAAEAFVLAANMSYRHVRALVWAALRRHHADVTVQKTGDLIQAAGGPESFFEQLKKLREASAPEGTSRPRKGGRGAGANTSPTPAGSASMKAASGG